MRLPEGADLLAGHHAGMGGVDHIEPVAGRFRRTLNELVPRNRLSAGCLSPGQCGSQGDGWNHRKESKGEVSHDERVPLTVLRLVSAADVSDGNKRHRSAMVTGGFSRAGPTRRDA